MNRIRVYIVNDDDDVDRYVQFFLFKQIYENKCVSVQNKNMMKDFR